MVLPKNLLQRIPLRQKKSLNNKQCCMSVCRYLASSSSSAIREPKKTKLKIPQKSFLFLSNERKSQIKVQSELEISRSNLHKNKTNNHDDNKHLREDKDKTNKLVQSNIENRNPPFPLFKNVREMTNSFQVSLKGSWRNLQMMFLSPLHRLRYKVELDLILEEFQTTKNCSKLLAYLSCTEVSDTENVLNLIQLLRKDNLQPLSISESTFYFRGETKISEMVDNIYTGERNYSLLVSHPEISPPISTPLFWIILKNYFESFNLEVRQLMVNQQDFLSPEFMTLSLTERQETINSMLGRLHQLASLLIIEEDSFQNVNKHFSIEDRTVLKGSIEKFVLLFGQLGAWNDFIRLILDLKAIDNILNQGQNYYEEIQKTVNTLDHNHHNINTNINRKDSTTTWGEEIISKLVNDLIHTGRIEQGLSLMCFLLDEGHGTKVRTKGTSKVVSPTNNTVNKDIVQDKDPEAKTIYSLETVEPFLRALLVNHFYRIKKYQRVGSVSYGLQKQSISKLIKCYHLYFRRTGNFGNIVNYDKDNKRDCGVKSPPDMKIVHLLIRNLGELGKVGQIHSILKKLECTKGYSFSSSLDSFEEYKLLIRAAIRARKIREGIRVLELCEERQIQPSAELLFHIAALFYRCGDYEKGRTLFQETLTGTFNLSKYLQENEGGKLRTEDDPPHHKHEKQRNEQFSASGIDKTKADKTSEFSIAVALRGSRVVLTDCLKVLQQVGMNKEAYQLFKEATKSEYLNSTETLVSSNSTTIKPDNRMYTIMLRVASIIGGVSKVKQMLQDAEVKHNLEIDTYMYNALISAYCDNGDPDGAIAALGECETKYVLDRPFLYVSEMESNNTLASTKYHDEKKPEEDKESNLNEFYADSTRDSYNQTRYHKYRPSTRIFNTIIHALGKEGRAHEAISWAKIASKERGLKLDEVTHRVLLQAGGPGALIEVFGRADFFTKGLQAVKKKESNFTKTEEKSTKPMPSLLSSKEIDQKARNTSKNLSRSKNRTVAILQDGGNPFSDSDVMLRKKKELEGQVVDDLHILNHNDRAIGETKDDIFSIYDDHDVDTEMLENPYSYHWILESRYHSPYNDKSILVMDFHGMNAVEAIHVLSSELDRIAEEYLRDDNLEAYEATESISTFDSISTTKSNGFSSNFLADQRNEQNNQNNRHEWPFIPPLQRELMNKTKDTNSNLHRNNNSSTINTLGAKKVNHYSTRIPLRIELITGQGHGSQFTTKNTKGKPVLKEAITKYLFEKGFSPIWPPTNPGKCYIDKRQIYAFLDEKDFQQRRNELFKICLYRTVPIWAVLVFPAIFPMLGGN